MKPSTPTFHHALVQSLVDAAFPEERERRLLMKGSAILPLTKEHLALTEQTLAQIQKDFLKVQQQMKDYEAVIALSKVIFQLTDNAEGEGLVDWHGQ